MKIALDYDGTVTEDPDSWAWFVAYFASAGHDIRIVTFRGEDELTQDMVEFQQRLISYGLKIVFTGHTTKHQHCVSIGWVPDVWIDDAPSLIDHPDKPWSKEKLDAWRKALPNRVQDP